MSGDNGEMWETVDIGPVDPEGWVEVGQEEKRKTALWLAQGGGTRPLGAVGTSGRPLPTLDYTVTSSGHSA